MAYTFLAAKGVPVGKSRVEEDKLELARQILDKAKAKGIDFELPVDHVCATEPKETAERVVVNGPPSPTGSWGSTSARRRWTATGSGSWPRRPSSGTARWASSSRSPGPRARSAWRRAMAESPGVTVVGGGDSAAAVEEAGLGRPDEAHLHRRRRQPGVHRGARAPGRQGPRGVNVARKKFICGNWKMHRTAARRRRWRARSAPPPSRCADRSTWPSRRPSRRSGGRGRLAGSRVGLGAQDLHWETQGAFTGEVSGPMLVDAGCRYVLVGHSERRQFFGDTDEAVRKKTRAALAAGLHPIVCVGETLPEREAGRTLEVVGRQVRAALSGLAAGAGRAPHRGLRAGLGHRHRQDRHPGAGAGGPRRPPRHPARAGADGSPTPSASSTGAPSSPTTPPSSCPGRTWTARWWAARASRH